MSPIIINNQYQIDPLRCVRHVRLGEASGEPNSDPDNFSFSGEGNEFLYVALPYLECIDVNVTTTNAIASSLRELYMPRLTYVAGKMTLDYRNEMEFIGMRALQSLEVLQVEARSNNTDLRGLDGLLRLQSFTLNNNFTGGDLAGLNGLIELHNFTINGGGAIVVNDGDASNGGFLESLLVVTGDVLINAAGSPYFYALGNIERINGELTIDGGNSTAEFEDLRGMESLQHVGGTLTIRSMDDLLALDGIRPAGLQVGRLVIEGNERLEDISQLSRITALGTVTIEGNPLIDCEDIEAYATASGANVSATECGL